MVIFNAMQGEVEFRSILYVPAITPMGREDIVNPKTKNIRLYVKRVFISDDFDGELVSEINEMIPFFFQNAKAFKGPLIM
jgi:HSP90 family molecular chaperone